MSAKLRQLNSPAMRTPSVCFECRLKCQLGLRLRRSFATTPLRRVDDPPVSSPTIRPATAPKPSLNVRHIRENAETYAQNCIDRNYKALAGYPSRIRALGEEAARLQHEFKIPRSKVKLVEKAIARLAATAAQARAPESQDPDQSQEQNALHAEARRLKDESEVLMLQREKCVEDMERMALTLPNLTSPETPVGDVPEVVGYINYDPNKPPAYASSSSSSSTPTRSHVSIGTDLGLLDFTSSTTSTGWGWYYLVNEGALLEHALVQYAISVALRRGWKAVSPPSLVYSYIAEACGFQPRDANNEQQIWAIEQTDRDRGVKPQRCLTGTAEIPLAAMHGGRDIRAQDLPIKLVASSRCYRAEAGARGVDTKGLYRVHEFTKVELFAWADDPGTRSGSGATSNSLFTEMLSIQSEILTALNIPCRILEMPSSDLGASATRKRDIEALFPSRIRHQKDESSAGDSDPDASLSSTDEEEGWGEVTSASICTDYQARRLGTRVRGGSGPGASRFPHTVNGTALAVPRIIAAILENGWDEEVGGVVVPEVLRGYMGGLEVIGGKKENIQG